MNYYDTILNKVITDNELARRGLTPAIAKQAGIVPMEYQYVAYNDDLYTQEPHELIVGDDKAVQTFIAVPVAIEIGKMRILEKVQAEKIRVRDGGLTLNGIKWDTDERAQAAYIKFFLKVTQDPTLTVTDWKASEGIWTEMNATVLNELSAALEQHETALFTWQRQKEAEINACETIEELEGVCLVYTGC